MGGAREVAQPAPGQPFGDGAAERRLDDVASFGQHRRAIIDDDDIGAAQSLVVGLAHILPRRGRERIAAAWRNGTPLRLGCPGAITPVQPTTAGMRFRLRPWY
jgi:hypothetical protein